jgi:predicted nuclease of predicted toxin-antitoxin system
VRLFLDQMFRVELAEELRAAGHNVVRASEAGLGRADDSEILSQAIAQKRVLVTLDAHFGDWAVLPLEAQSGVIRVKVNPTTTANVLKVLRALLAGRREDDFANHLVIASTSRARWIRTGPSR